MKPMRMAAALATVMLWGCSGVDDQRNAMVTTALGNDFTGNSVRIHGVRSTLADPKYPCLNEFDVCLAFDPAGGTPAVQDLCPSDDTPSGTWSFSYLVYADSACTTPLANLGCAPDLGEWLTPGHNTNHVTCTTRNADKGWDFCVVDPVTGAGSEACPDTCVPPDPGTCNSGDPLPPPDVGTRTVYHLGNTNTAQLQGVDFQVTQYLQGGNLRLELCKLHNPVYNSMLGVDMFYYDAAYPPYGLLAVNESGWSFNGDGTQADGFGNFGSHKNASSAGRGGVSCADPLVFTLNGDPTTGANTPLELAIHARWDEDCSGFISNRTTSSLGSSPGCRALPPCDDTCLPP